MTQQPDCPVKAAHRRYMDCHAQWHAASVAYMEPDDFRHRLNGLVQELRNVSWLVQKQKADLNDFASWYEPWQEEARADPVMRWVVNARNRITKEADLEINSTAKLTVISSFWRRDEQVLSVPPRLTSRQMINQMRHRFLNAGVSPREAVMSVERRWVDAALPDWEVLAAAAHAMEQLRRLLLIAHEHAADSACSLGARSLPCVDDSLEPRSLDCLSDDREFRRAHMSLLSMDEIVRSRLDVESDMEASKIAAERYGQTEPFDFNSGPYKLAPVVFERAKKVLVTDGHHINIVWLFKGNRVIALQPLVFPDQTSKYVTMEEVGRRAEQLQSDGFMILGENWVAHAAPGEDWSDPHEIIPPRYRADRMEALHLMAMTADGKGVDYMNIFSRNESNEIVLGEDVISAVSPKDGGFFTPLTRHWPQSRSETA